MIIPAQTPLREWESETSWSDVFSGCGVLTPRTAWTRQPEREGDPTSTQRWADSEGRGVIIAEDLSTGAERVYDDPERPTGWLALTDAAQRVHAVSKIDVLALACGAGVEEAARAVAVFIDPVIDRLDIWAQPGMRDIARHAVARGTNPYSVLGTVLSHIAANVSPHLYFPGRRRTGFNVAFCAIGFSGSGKGTSAELAADLVRIEGGDHLRAGEVSLKTWEGASKKMKMPDFAAQAEYEKQKENQDKDTPAATPETPGFAVGMDANVPGVHYGHDQAPVIYEDEFAARKYEFVHGNKWFARVDELATFLGDRNGGSSGAGMQPVTAMISSENVGADLAGESRSVPAHSYRIAICASRQPRKTVPLLVDTHGGVRQRFIFTPALVVARAHHAAVEAALGELPSDEDYPAEDERVSVSLALRQATGPVPVHPDVKREVRRRADSQQEYTAGSYVADLARGDEPANGHRDLAALRAHFLISVLLGADTPRSTVEAWVIADALMEVSDWLVEDTLLGAGRAARTERVTATAEEMEDKEAAAAAVEASRLDRCRTRLAEKLCGAGNEGMTRAALRAATDSKLRSAMDAAVDEAIAGGWVDATTTTMTNGQTSMTLRLVGEPPRSAA